MQIKEGVILSLHESMMPALIICESCFRKAGYEFVVTSGVEGRHSPNSLHYFGRAIDCRINHILSDRDVELIADTIRRRLGETYDVVLEADHLHIEYDPGNVNA